METIEQIMKEVGWCEFFDIEPFIKAANILVAADEPLRALQLLDNLPGYYRDNIPEEVEKIRSEIYALLATPTFYTTNKYDAFVRADEAEETVDKLLRGQLIQADVKKYNDEGKTPHIVDLGPGEYWLPIGLKKKGLSFTYKDIGLCIEAKEKAAAHIGNLWTEPAVDAPVIFVACELIEHLHHETDIRVEMEKLKLKPDVIHISTPLYTFDGRKHRLEWQKQGDLGHLRTYTPKEFSETIVKMFPTHTWMLTVSQIMHMRGFKL